MGKCTIFQECTNVSGRDNGSKCRPC